MSIFDILSATLSNELIGDVAGNYALISSPNRNIGGLFTDVTIEEVHNDRLEVTQHPIQTGAVVTDHSFAQPAALTIRCGSSDCSAGYNGAVIQQYDAFLALQASRQPFSVCTGKRNYDNMLIRDLQVTTDERTETAIMFVVQLQQITFTSAGPSVNSATMPWLNPATNMGTVQTQTVTTPQPFLTGGVGGIPVANPAAKGGIGSA